MHKVEKYITKEQLKYIVYGILIIIGISLLLGIVSLFIYILNYYGYIEKFLEWIASIGFYGNLVMILCILVVNFPFMVGYGTLMFASGFLFKFKYGLLTVVVGCQIGVLIVGLLIRIKYIRERSQQVFFLIFFLIFYFTLIFFQLTINNIN